MPVSECLGYAQSVTEIQLTKELVACFKRSFVLRLYRKDDASSKQLFQSIQADDCKRDKTHRMFKAAISQKRARICFNVFIIRLSDLPSVLWVYRFVFHHLLKYNFVRFPIKTRRTHLADILSVKRGVFPTRLFLHAAQMPDMYADMSDAEHKNRKHQNKRARVDSEQEKRRNGQRRAGHGHAEKA